MKFFSLVAISTIAMACAVEPKIQLERRNSQQPNLLKLSVSFPGKASTGCWPALSAVTPYDTKPTQKEITSPTGEKAFSTSGPLLDIHMLYIYSPDGVLDGSLEGIYKAGVPQTQKVGGQAEAPLLGGDTGNFTFDFYLDENFLPAKFDLTFSWYRSSGATVKSFSPLELGPRYHVEPSCGKPSIISLKTTRTGSVVSVVVLVDGQEKANISHTIVKSKI